MGIVEVLYKYRIESPIFLFLWVVNPIHHYYHIVVDIGSSIAYLILYYFPPHTIFSNYGCS